ncbi:MAG: nucleotidyl transferase AbiEii/AbiGii toxin family protein [bacterium]
MSLNQIKHKNILIKILKDIFTDAAIGQSLGFKGGTAAYLFYNLPRFSVDLDFDLLDASRENFIFEQVKIILEKYGTLKEAAMKKFNLLFILSYDNKEEKEQNVKVEINRRNFGSKFEVKTYLGISMKVMAEEDMFANKLMAMYERIGKTNRDIFDVWFFLKNDWPINKKIAENRAGISFKDFLTKCIAVLEKMDGANILAGMGELLSEDQKKWAKQNLKKDAIFLLKLKLDEYK